MSNAITVNIDTSQLDRNIPNFVEKLKKAVKEAIIKTSVENVAKNAYQNLTSKNHVVTGRLRKSIHAKYNNKYANSSYLSHRYMSDVSGENFTGSLSETPNDLTVIIGTDVPYARKIEFQYDAYLFPALEGCKSELKSAIQNAISRL